MPFDDREPPPPLPSDIALPHSVDAEREVLSALLVDPRCMDRVLEAELAEEDFYVERHGLLFRTMRALYESDNVFDMVLLHQRLKDEGLHEKIGGNRALAELMKRAGTSAHVDHYCSIVRDKAQIRRMIDAARSIEADGLRGVTDVDGFLEDCERSIMEVRSIRARSAVREMRDVLKTTLEEIQRAADSDASVTGLPTGFHDFDKITHGLQKGDLIVIAARPAMGKTSFVLNLATNVALKADASVMIFSLEMPSEQLAQRMLGSLARIDVSTLRNARMLSADDWPNLMAAMDDLAAARIFIDDTPGVSHAEVRAKCRRLAQSHGLDLIVVDYLQLMEARGRDRQMPREQQVSMMSRSLKGLAKELGVPVIALSQMNRSIEKRAGGDSKPMLSDLRESGAIEQDADMIGFIHREDALPNKKDLPPEKQGMAELIIAKHRNGPTGKVDLRFEKSWTRFMNVSRREEAGYL